MSIDVFNSDWLRAIQFFHKLCFHQFPSVAFSSYVQSRDPQEPGNEIEQILTFQNGACPNECRDFHFSHNFRIYRYIPNPTTVVVPKCQNDVQLIGKIMIF